MEQNEVYMDSLEAKTALFRAELEKLILGDGGLQQFAKTIVDLGTKILKFANSDFGQVVTVMIATSTALSLLIKGFALLKSSIVVTTIATEGLASALALLNLNPVVLAITAVVGAFYAVNKIMEHFNDETLEDHKEKLEELIQEDEKLKGEIEGIEKSLEDTKKRIEEINRLKLKITDAEQLDKLEKESKELEEQEQTLKRQLALLKLQQQEKRKEREEEAKATLGTTTSTGQYRFEVDPETGVEGGMPIEIRETPVEKLSRLNEEYEHYNKVLEGAKQKQLGLIGADGKIIEGQEEIFKSYQNIIDDTTQKTLDLETEMTTLASTIQEATDSLDGEGEGFAGLGESEQEIIEKNTEVLDKTYELTGATEEAEEELNKYNETNEDLLETQEEIDKELQKLIDKLSLSGTTVDKLKQSFETLGKVTKELNSDQGLTVETYTELMSMGSNYVNALFDEEGQLRDTADAQRELYSAKIDQMAVDQAMLLIDTAKHYYDTYGSLEGLSNQTKVTTANTWGFVYSELALLEATGEDTSAIRVQIAQYQAWAEQAKANIGTMTASTKATKSHTDALKDQKKAYEDAINYIKSRYDDVINALKDEKDSMVDSIEKQITARKEQKEVEINAIEEEIKALEEEKQLREDYWDEQINALKEQNSAYKDSIELQEKLDALARAKSTKVKVYREGQGFVYEEDSTAVNKAQSELSEYLKEKQYEDELGRLEELKKAEIGNYDDRIKSLQNFKDERVKFYDADIESLEKYKKSVEENYNSQIKIYQDYKQQFQDMVDAYKDNQSKLLASQITGIDMENDNWMARLDNLKSFVDQYHKLLAQTESTSTSSGGGGVTSALPTDDDGGDTPDYTGVLSKRKGQEDKVLVYDKNGHYQGTESIADVSKKYKNIKFSSYAKGSPYIKDDELAVVGENPNKEIVIGSRLNNDNGLIMNLSKGSGVVNAQSTGTLAGLFNSIKGSNYSERDITNNNGNNISIGNISLPEVKNGRDFVDYLQNFSMDITQLSYARS